MSWYILYPVSGAKITRNGRVKIRKTKPTKPVLGYGFAEGPLPNLKAVARRLNAMGVWDYRRPIHNGRKI